MNRFLRITRATFRRSFIGGLALLAVALAIPNVVVAAANQDALVASVLSGVFNKHYIGAASTNSTLVVAGSATQKRAFVGVNYVNTNATTYYLKLYDKATAPTCGTDTPFAVFQMLQNVQKSSIMIFPRQLVNGLGFCMVGGVADSDTSNANTGISADIAYTPQ